MAHRCRPSPSGKLGVSNSGGHLNGGEKKKKTYGFGGIRRLEQIQPWLFSRDLRRHKFVFYLTLLDGGKMSQCPLGSRTRHYLRKMSWRCQCQVRLSRSRTISFNSAVIPPMSIGKLFSAHNPLMVDLVPCTLFASHLHEGVTVVIVP